MVALPKRMPAACLAAMVWICVTGGCGRRDFDLPPDVKAELDKLGDPAPLTEPETVAVPETQPPAIKPFRDWTAAETAADTLGRIGPNAVPQLIPLLANPDPATRIKAIEVLARIGPQARDAVGPLTYAVRDPDPHVRKMAIYALGQIGPDSAAAAPELIRVLVEGS